MAVTIQLNGEEMQFDDATTIEHMVAQLGLELEKIAVERNREIVPKSTYANAPLHDGDDVEIIQFVGGG